MKTVSIGIIGIGNIGSAHAVALRDGRVEGARLSAICDIDPQKQAWARENLPDVSIYDNHRDFFDHSGVDAVILSVPHYFHPPYAMEGFAHGMHVLSEKPAGVAVSAVKEMMEAAKASGKVFGIMWNQRTDPMYQEVRRMVQEGELGKPLRLMWQTTRWYRTQEYYDSGTWRATWDGEGGGVLMNQAPHQLDLMQWIFGVPTAVRAECAMGKYHDIEVEDEATLFCRFENGATGIFHTTTGEEHGVNRLEIFGTTGRLTAEGRTLTIYRKDGKQTTVETKEFETSGGQHVEILNNFAAAIRDGSPLLAPGYEGLAEIEICNAAYLSVHSGKEEAIPTDTKRFDALLRNLRATSKGKGRTTQEAPDGIYKKRWSNL